MDPEIKRRLDEQLGSGGRPQEANESYNRKLEALQEADAILARMEDERARAEALRISSADGEHSKSPTGLALYWFRATAALWIIIQLALLVLVAVLLSKLGPFVPLSMMVGYLVGAVVGIPTFLIGWYRKSTLTSTSWWAAMIGGAVSLGLLSLPIAIYFGYRIIRQPMDAPDPTKQTA